MKIVTIHEAKTHLSRLIQDALRGEEIVIARGKRQLVRLQVLESEKPERVIGLHEGQIEIAPDFDALLEDFDEYQ